MHRHRWLATRTLRLAAALSGIALSATAATAQFVPKDQIVSDNSVSIPNPSFDQISNLMVWQDVLGNAWLARINPVTGAIVPGNGKGKLLDNKAADPDVTGNTVMFAGGDGFSSIILTREAGSTYALGEVMQDANQVWSLQNTVNYLNRWKPEGTHANWQGAAREAYNYLLKSGQQVVAWREVGNAASEQQISGASANEGARWIEGDNGLLASLLVNGIKQVAYIDLDAAHPTPVQVTFEAQDTFNAYSWFAPDLNAPVFSAMIGPQQLGIFRKMGPSTWQKYYTMTIPSDFNYFSSPEGFVWNGKSYVFFVAMKQPGDGRFPYQPSGPSQVWIAGIDPANPFFRRIDDPTRHLLKAEPEVYFTASGPKIFYGERPANGNWAIRMADTGLGVHWGYDNQAYYGPWAAPHRDNKNCSCTPFPVGDSYNEVGTFPSLFNAQWSRQIMGPEGNLYTPLISDQSRGNTVLTAYNSQNAAQVFQASALNTNAQMLNNGLIAANGDVLMGANALLARLTSNGTKVWSAALRGTPTGLQYAPEGNVLAFTMNGWFQVLDPNSGALLREINVMPELNSATAPLCMQRGRTSDCGTVTAPAVDTLNSRVLTTYMSGGNSKVRAYTYDRQSHNITLLWDSQLFSGNIGSPVLSADYARVYIQSKDGKLYALNAANGALIWSFDLGVSTTGTPVVSDFGYIMPGSRQSDSSTVNYVGIVKDQGASAAWAFKTTDFAAQSGAAVGTQNRFVLMARRTSDQAQVLLTVSPKFGVMSQRQVTLGPLPGRATGVVLDQNGWVYVGTSGQAPYRAFSPNFATTLQ